MRSLSGVVRRLFLSAFCAGIFAVGMAGCGKNDGSAHFNPPITYGTFTDTRDGQSQTYRTVVMPDGKTWMADNLNYQTANSWCYDNDDSNCAKYGRLYTWSAAMVACPSGWRLPMDVDWDVLMTAVGGASTASWKLKSASGWRDGGNGTDEYGFSALPGGTRWSAFFSIGETGFWWTATEYEALSALYRYMFYKFVDVGSYWEYKGCGLSVRCLRE